MNKTEVSKEEESFFLLFTLNHVTRLIKVAPMLAYWYSLIIAVLLAAILNTKKEWIISLKILPHWKGKILVSWESGVVKILKWIVFPESRYAFEPWYIIHVQGQVQTG